MHGLGGGPQLSAPENVLLSACSLPALQALNPDGAWVSFLFFFFLHGYFYPFVLPSLGLWVHVTDVGARGCRQKKGGLGGDFDHNKANDAGPQWSS